MRKRKFSIKEYFRDIFRDERQRKPFLVGLAVFIIVFIGLTIYQQTVKEQGDVILSGGTAESGQTADSGQDTNSGRDGKPGQNANVGENRNADAGGNSSGSGSDVINGNNGRDDINAEGYSSGQVGTDAEPIAIFVDIGGAVNISGMFALPPGSRVDDAIKLAGGLREDADMRFHNRAAVLNDGDRLYIPTESEVRSGNVPPSAGRVTESGGYYGNASGGQSGSSGNNTGSSNSSTGGSSGGNNSGNGNSSGSSGNSGNGNSQVQTLININTANSEELQKLNGVGPVTAQKIIDYRTNRGAFKRIEELMNVSGIGAKTFEKLRNYITV